jgi:hypothetical protein
VIDVLFLVLPVLLKSQKVVNGVGTSGVATRRHQPSRNLSAALDNGHPSSERPPRGRPPQSAGLRSSSRVVLSPEENGSVSPVSSSPSSSPSKSGVKVSLVFLKSNDQGCQIELVSIRFSIAML